MPIMGKTHVERPIPTLSDGMRVKGRVADREAAAVCSCGGGRGDVVGKVTT